MNDMRLHQQTKYRQSGVRKAQASQKYPYCEYYTEETLPIEQRSIRKVIKSMSRTELSQERAKSKTRRDTDSNVKSPYELRENIELCSRQTNVQSTRSRMSGSQRLSLLHTEGQAHQLGSSSSSKLKIGHSPKCSNKVQTHRLLGKGTQRLTEGAENIAEKCHANGLNKKSANSVDEKTTPLQIQLPASSALQDLLQKGPHGSQNQQNYQDISQVLQNGPNYLRVSNYSVGGDLGEISCIKEPQESASERPECSLEDHNLQLSLINYLSKFRDEETTDHIEGEEYIEQSYFLAPQKTTHSIMKKFERYNQLLSYKTSDQLLRINAHMEIIGLYAEMSRLDEVFAGCPSWHVLQALLYSKFHAERVRVEMALRGHTNCFTMQGIQLSSHQLRQFQRMPQSASLIGQVGKENEKISSRLKRLTNRLKAHKVDFDERMLTNSLLMKELKKEYVRLCSFGHEPKNFEKLAWTVAAVLLTEQLQNSVFHCFTNGIQVPSVEWYLLSNYPHFNQILQQF